MMMQKTSKLVAVVVPIYQSEIAHTERISLQQCKKILGHYPTFFVKPKNLAVNYVQEFYEQPTFQIFDDRYFSSVAAYNELLISPAFYERFKEYEYVLIYQLDAFVFKDELQNWCKKGFDYVGAPAPRSGDEKTDSIRQNFRPLLLNGGLSLRKISTTIRFLKVYHALYPRWPANEDTLFSIYHRRVFPLGFLLKRPDFRAALPFAFEKKPDLCLKINQNQLPFGCHAWEKYDPDFWRPYFKELGYEWP